MWSLLRGPRPTRLLALAVIVALGLAARTAVAVNGGDPRVLIITGRAGAGKGTVATALAKKHGTTKWASGDVFRAKAKRVLAAQGLHREPLPAEVSREAAITLEAGDEAFGEELGRTILEQGHGPLVIVEGLRSREAVVGFRRVFPQAKVAALQVSAKRRHEAVLKIRSKGTPGGTGESARPGEDAAALRARDRGDAKLGVGRLIAQRDVRRIRPRKIDPDDYRTLEEVQAAIAVVTAESVTKLETLLGL